MENQFIRTEMLLGPEAMEKLRHSHVAVVGLGGVGGWCAEALCRTGVGELTLLDEDVLAGSNLNRQMAALYSTLGMEKAEAAALRLRDISPACAVHPVCGRYEADTRERFFSMGFDYIVDAIDLVSCKLDLIETACQRGVPIVSALGTGNKLDAQQLRLDDISRTEGCPLARVVRKELRRRGILHHRVVFSPEPARRPLDCGEQPVPGRRSIPASVAWVPPVAGLRLAGEVVLSIAGLPPARQQ